MHASSGTTAVATLGDTAVTLIGVPSGITYNINRLIVINEGAGAGFASIDGGNTWHRIPAAAGATSPICVIIEGPRVFNTAILLKRVASGTNMAGVYASVY